jgi:DNA-binding GntR family transcriptional regulator
MYICSSMKNAKSILIKTNPSVATTVLPRQTLVTTVVNALRQRIISGEFGDGESLNQVAIARGYTISRIPLREAMRQLEAEGLVVFKPGKGAVVSSLSLEEIAEVIDLRSRIEPDLLTRAIPNLTNTELDEATLILDEYETAFVQGNIATWGDFNWRFHSTLYAPSRCTLTMGILEGLHRLNQRYARVQISLTHWEERASREHREILDACVRRNIEEAASLLKNHIVAAGQALTALIEEKHATAEIL